jgi:hypothetical protein
MGVTMYKGGGVLLALCILFAFFVARDLFRRRHCADKREADIWKSLPKTGEAWLHLVLVPVKSYAVLAYPFLTVSLGLVSGFSLLNDEAQSAADCVSRGYLVTASLLILGAIAQIKICRFCHVIETMGYLLLGLTFWWLTGEISFDRR